MVMVSVMVVMTMMSVMSLETEELLVLVLGPVGEHVDSELVIVISRVLGVVLSDDLDLLGEDVKSERVLLSSSVGLVLSGEEVHEGHFGVLVDSDGGGESHEGGDGEFHMVKKFNYYIVTEIARLKA